MRKSTKSRMEREKLKNRIQTMNIGGMQVQTIDITKEVGKALEKAGFGDDSNKETDIAKAGMWDVLDALSGKNNKKFSVAQAEKEYNRRMGI